MIKAAGLRTGVGPHMLDETDTEQPTIYAEVLQWQLGTLSTNGSHPRGRGEGTASIARVAASTA